MNIAVIGQSKGNLNDDVLAKARRIGEHIAANKARLLFGGCMGYPYEAAKGAGNAVAISPASSVEEHKNKYGFPDDVEIELTGAGIPGRNLLLVEKADRVIMIGGKIGTLNEFTLAYHLNRPIAVLEESGGVAALVRDIDRKCSKPGARVFIGDVDSIISWIFENDI